MWQEHICTYGVLLCLLGSIGPFFLCAQHINKGAPSSTFDFGACLIELRLDELLRLKRSLYPLENTKSVLLTLQHNPENDVNGHSDAVEAIECSKAIDIDGCRRSDINHEKPVALALVNSKNGVALDRGGYSKLPPATTYHHYHHTWHPAPEEKPSKLQTLFQISITALAFLSFGGYLLCLIVQAIKSKGTTYFHPVGTATTTTMNGTGVRRIKIYRRSRRYIIPNKNNIYMVREPQGSIPTSDNWGGIQWGYGNDNFANFNETPTGQVRPIGPPK